MNFSITTTTKEFAEGLKDGQGIAFCLAKENENGVTESEILSNITGMLEEQNDGLPIEWRGGWVCGLLTGLKEVSV